MNEAKYKRLIRKAINEDGGKAIPLITGESTARGEPDIFGVYQGIPFVIEAKIGKNTPTPIQLERLEEWFKVGTIALLSYYPDHEPQAVAAYLSMLFEDGTDSSHFLTLDKLHEDFFNFCMMWNEND